MAIHTISVGSIRQAGVTQIDRTYKVEFDGDKLAEREVTIDPQGTLGFSETLYYTAGKELMVHIAHWSGQRGDTVTYTLLQISGRELSPGGRFELLGRDAWAWLRL